MIDVVDNEHIDWPSCRFQLQSEFFLDRGEDRGTARIYRWRYRGIWRRLSSLRLLGSPRQIDIKVAVESRSIDDDTLNERLKRPHELRERNRTGCQRTWPTLTAQKGRSAFDGVDAGFRAANAVQSRADR